MRASDLSWDAKQGLLSKIREQVGSSKYDDLVAVLGEDGLIDHVLSAAESAPAVAPKPTFGERAKGWLRFLATLGILIGGFVGMAYGQGGALGIFAGIIAGGIFGAWNFSEAPPLRRVMAGVGGAVGGGISGWKFENGASVWYLLPFCGALLGWLIEKFIELMESVNRYPRY